jgi:methionyl-tRNA formyltransferase
MGTPDFALPPLEMLCKEGYAVPLAVTRPDQPRDRGKRVQSPPVKAWAEAQGIPVLQPESLRGNAEFAERLRAEKPDLIVVAAYGALLPEEILNLPGLGCVNIHASLLPKYRGAAPIQRAVLDGGAETGVSLMRMAEKMDAGNVIAARKTPIGRKTTAELFGELSQMGAALLRDKLPDIAAGAPGAAQDEAQATYAPRIRKEEAHIDFSKSPEEIERLIRGMNAWPGAYALYKGSVLKIWEAVPSEEPCEKPAGTILAASGEGITVAAGGRAVRLTVIQAQGKKAMQAADFMRGNKLEIQAVLT